MAKQDGRPRHQQIAADIRARIISGDLAAGAQLPIIRDLAEQYGVNGSTIQQVVATLKDEGFLIGKKGQGVYVRDRQPFVVDIEHYFAPTPGGYSYKILDVAEVVPPADVAAALGLAEGDVAMLRHRLTLHGGVPVDLSWAYYPIELARGTELAERRKIPGGAPRVLADLGYPWQSFADEVSLRPPTTEEVKVLELPDGVSVLRQFRIVRSLDGRPVEASVLIKGGHLYVLRYHQVIH